MNQLNKENSIEAPRQACALHGALQTVQAVPGFRAILHTTAGCGVQQALAGGWCAGNADYLSCGTASTNVQEKHVVFGGASRLREQIKNTVKIDKADLYVVLTGCAAELVGDDVPAMVKESVEQGNPVVYVSTPGFKGDVHQGYTIAVESLARNVAVQEGKIRPGLVNILGIIPFQDIYWRGDLEFYAEALAQIGYRVNDLFGPEAGLINWKQLAAAEWNLVVSPAGREVARFLQQQFHTPYHEVSIWPVGQQAEEAFLKQLSLSDRWTQLAAGWSIRRRRLEDHALSGLAEAYYRAHVQRTFSIVGEYGQSLGIARFLTDVLGLLPVNIILTDPLQREDQQYIRQELSSWNVSDVHLLFTEDTGDIREQLMEYPSELVLGSSLDEDAAAGVPFLPVSYPARDSIILNKSYLGAVGSIRLLEDLLSQLLKEKNSA